MKNHTLFFYLNPKLKTQPKIPSEHLQTYKELKFQPFTVKKIGYSSSMTIQ